MKFFFNTCVVEGIFLFLVSPVLAGGVRGGQSYKSFEFGIKIFFSDPRWKLSEIEEDQDQLEVLFKDDSGVANFLLLAVPSTNITNSNAWKEKELKTLLKWYGGSHVVTIITSKVIPIKIFSGEIEEVLGNVTKYTLQINKNTREVSLIQFISSRTSYLLFIYNSGKQEKQENAIREIVKGIWIIKN